MPRHIFRVIFLGHKYIFIAFIFMASFLSPKKIAKKM